VVFAKGHGKGITIHGILWQPLGCSQNQILNVKLGGSLSQILGNTYSPEDLNMDGTVKWNGPNNDQNVLLNIALRGSLSAIYNE
jgi:hypothetical protein